MVFEPTANENLILWGQNRLVVCALFEGQTGGVAVVYKGGGVRARYPTQTHKLGVMGPASGPRQGTPPLLLCLGVCLGCLFPCVWGASKNGVFGVSRSPPCRINYAADSNPQMPLGQQKHSQDTGERFGFSASSLCLQSVYLSTKQLIFLWKTASNGLFSRKKHPRRPVLTDRRDVEKPNCAPRIPLEGQTTAGASRCETGE